MRIVSGTRFLKVAIFTHIANRVLFNDKSKHKSNNKSNNKSKHMNKMPHRYFRRPSIIYKTVKSVHKLI